MSDAGVDDLIDELFPVPGKRAAPLLSSAPVHSTQRRASDWDDESDGEGKAAVKDTQPTHTGGHGFDDDSSSSDDDETSKRGASQGKVATTSAAAKGGAAVPSRRLSASSSAEVTPHLRRGLSSRVIFPVPFPSLADSEGCFACAARCYLTNLGASLRGVGGGDRGHPSLSQLRTLAANESVIAGCTRPQAMLKKGAMHAVQARLGNGCLDHHGDFTSDGGCPHVLCRKCNYMVVRLQGAEWEDSDGKVNLYLTLRNYYPDWCRLASAVPVGVEDEDDSARRPVLRANAAAAAYCCQCSWVSVTAAKAVIETKLTDAFRVAAGAEDSHPFATALPLVAGEKRRPPLWVCHGHPQ